MDDRFLYEARREPRPEISANLRAKLRRQGPERSGVRWLTLRPGAAVAAGLVMLVAAALIAFPSVRASAQAFLDLFRVRNFAAVEFDPARLDKLQSLRQDNALLVFDRQGGSCEPTFTS